MYSIDMDAPFCAAVTEVPVNEDEEKAFALTARVAHKRDVVFIFLSITRTRTDNYVNKRVGERRIFT